MNYTPHKYAEVIKAWADGKAIQHRNADGTWQDSENVGYEGYYAPWSKYQPPHLEWRIKPEKKIGGLILSCFYL